MRRITLVLMVLAILMTTWIYREQVASTGAVVKSGEAVISLGQDLTEDQKSQVVSYFETKTDLAKVRYVSVSNQEERRYLEGKIAESLIGTRAISCALVTGSAKGQGIDVQTHNINGVTPFMYANAANTAGIEDVQIFVEAPFEVSGTAALTGIIKAFELASGKALNETAKDIANQELAESSKLGEKIGQDNAGKIIYEVKKQVVQKKIADPALIRQIIVQVSADLNISLAEDDVNRIVGLMQNLNKVNINISQLNEQLDKLQKGIEDVRTQTDQAQGFFQKLVKFIRNLFQGLTGAIS
ncbi:MAG: DUF1002 domain-containing protein [Firmicutes bacterium HGW-Firmicutes-15]|nr:MAG: DUF1002 domain-containing protein [Firmicutes bacterium HGW-Firmicutes-15]